MLRIYDIMKHATTDYIDASTAKTCSGLMKTVLNNVVLPALFIVVNNIVHHCYTRFSTTCSVLLTTLNNVDSKKLFNAAFIRPEQVVRFWLCIYYKVNSAKQLGINVLRHC